MILHSRLERERRKDLIIHCLTDELNKIQFGFQSPGLEQTQCDCITLNMNYRFGSGTGTEVQVSCPSEPWPSDGGCGQWGDLGSVNTSVPQTGFSCPEPLERHRMESKCRVETGCQKVQALHLFQISIPSIWHMCCEADYHLKWTKHNLEKGENLKGRVRRYLITTPFTEGNCTMGKWGSYVIWEMVTGSLWNVNITHHPSWDSGWETIISEILWFHKQFWNVWVLPLMGT